MTEYEAYGHSRKPQPEDVNLLENKKLKETNLGKFGLCCDYIERIRIFLNLTCGWVSGSGDLHCLGVKRKQLLDDVSQFKRLKINENHSGTLTRHAS